MTNDEYKSFLKYVFHEFIEKRIHRLGRYFDHPKMFHEWDWQWRRLRKGLHLMRYIQDVCNDTNDIYETFRRERLAGAIDEIEDGMKWHNRLAEESGFFDAWDSHYEEIVAGLGIDLIPETEFDLLRELGFADPKAELEGIMYVVKKRTVRDQKYRNSWSISFKIKQVEKDLSEAKNDLKAKKDDDPDNNSNEKRPKKKDRRWFKGIGQIGQGTALSIGDIALAAGALNFPVSPETQTFGALVSATTGVGMILTGIGELRGE